MIYTGYFAYLKRYMKEGLIPFSIARKSPQFYDGHRILMFAPEEELLWKYKNGEVDAKEYARRYWHYLNNLDLDVVTPIVNALKQKNVILLCYEKPTDFCHRHVLAKWLVDNFDVSVEEYEVN